MAEELKSWLSRRPFEAFRVVTSSGESYVVRHPEVALLVKGGLYVGMSASDNGDIPDRAAFCSMLHITAVEPILTPTTK